MGNLVFQATLGGQVNLVGPNTASTFNLNVPAVAGTLVTTGDTGTVTNTMLAGSIANAKLLNSSVTIGSTAVSLGSTVTAFAGITTLSMSGNLTLSGGTANGVAYLNGSNVVTTGSALTFDGTNLGLGVTPSAWATFTGFQVGALGGVNIGGATGDNFYAMNAYYNGGWKYAATGYTSLMYRMVNGEHRWSNAASGTAGNAITFTQAMTLDASGNLLVGNTTNGLSNKNSISLEPYSGGAYAVFNHASGTTSGSQYTFFGYNGSSIGSITQSGTTAVLYNVTSDQRLKENIVDAAPSSDLIDAIKVRQYDWKSDGSHQRYGFIAQELLAVAPEAVHQPADPEEMMAVDYSKLVPMLVKEIQSLRKRLAAAGI